MLVFKITILYCIWSCALAALPCGDIHRDLAVPCRCDIRQTNLLEQGIGVLMDCDRVVFPGDLPVLPHRAPIIGFSHRYSGHQLLPTQAFVRSQLPLQKLDFSHNLLRRLTDRFLHGLAKTLEELNLSHNLLGDNLNPIFASAEFHNLENLRVLDLSSNKIRGVEEGILRGCVHLQELRLDENLLTTVPSQSLNGPRNLRILSLKYNRIRSIKQSSFTSQGGLERIRLDGNDLNTIEGGAFSGLSKLRELSISRNKFVRFNSDVFQGIENVERLDLSQNFLTEFPNLALKITPHIKHINLSSNLIKTLEHAQLGSYTYLDTIDLSRNNIASISPGTFLNLRKLRHLDLSVNSLRTVEDDAFEGLDNLEVLSLEDNNILLVPASALGRLSKLTSLNLAYNRISAVSREILRSTAGQLTTLILSRNVIREVPSGSFQDLSNLKRLDLNGNLLTRVDGETFVGLEETLESLNLAQNKLTSLTGPPLILPNLKWLDLSENQINDLPWTALSSVPNLKYLNVSHNTKMYALPNNLLHRIPMLSVLDASECDLKGITSDFFLHSANLKTLILSGNLIQEIPELVFKNLKNVTYLDASRNKITNIKTGALGHLTNLKILHLYANKLSAFKGEFFNRPESKNFTTLEYLDISDNELSYLFPSSFKIHPKLKEILARNNHFNYFPSELVANLQFLERIDLSSNKLKTVEDMDFSRLPRLRVLDVSKNELESISESAFHNSTQLQVLDFSSNQINRLGERIFEGLMRLESLNLNNNQLTELPETIFERNKLQMLENIYLSKNKFSIPPLKSLQKQYFFLSSVDLSWNQIKDITAEDSTMVNIKYLNLSYNPLTKESIVNVLGEPKTVRSLDLSGVGIDKITHLEMPFLQRLNISHNNITELGGKVFERSTLLEKLDVSSNKITQLDHLKDSIEQLKSLRELDLSDNPILDIVATQFDNLTELRTLNINDLKYIMKIEKNVFKNLTNLLELRAFNYPRLGYLDVQGILQYLPTLEVLEIEMKDKTITSDELSYIMHPRLRHLSIYGSSVQSISTGVYAGIKSPRIELRLLNTSLTNLPQGLFFPLPRSSSVAFDITGSKLSTITPQFLSMFEDHRKHLKLLGLETNPIVCDCHSKTLKRWVLANKHISVICHKPNELAGKQLKTIPDDELSCEPRKTTTTTTSVRPPTSIITKATRKHTTEPEIIWSLTPKYKKTTMKPPKLITSANAATISNDDTLIIGIVGGVVAFIAILIIVICIVRLRMINNQYQGGPLAAPVPYISPNNPYVCPGKPPPSLYMAPSYATLPHKMMNGSEPTPSLKHYPTLRPPSQLQSYYQGVTAQNQSAFYIPYTPDEKIEYR